MNRLRRPRALLGVAIVAAGLALLLLGPALVAAQESQAPEDEGWPELSPQACSERAAEADMPRMSSFLDELVADAVIDQDQADDIEQRLRERGASACVGLILYQPGQAVEAAAELTGTEPRDVLRALRDGATLAEYAAQYDLAEEQLIDAILADSKARAAELVAAGELDQAQADDLLRTIEERVSAAIHNTQDELPPRWHGLGERIGAAAEALSGMFGR